MEAIILVTQRQEESFHRRAALFGIPVREEGSTSPTGKYYIATIDYPGELFVLGNAIGFDEGLGKAHEPSKELLN